MTKREAAIVSAYTNYLVGSFTTMDEYVEEKLGRPVWTHQFPELYEEIREKTKADYIALEVV